MHYMGGGGGKFRKFSTAPAVDCSVAQCAFLHLHLLVHKPLETFAVKAVQEADVNNKTAS